MIRTYLAGLLLIALLLACIAALWYRGSALSARNDLGNAIAEREAAYQDIASLSATLATERARATRMAEIAGQYERDKTDAQARADRLAADLLSGDRRVRYEIAALHTARLSADAAATRELDAAAQRGAALVGAAIGVGAECDATQRGLIEAYGAGWVVAEDRR